MSNASCVNPRLNSGHPACAGCGATVAMNLAARHFPAKTVMVNVASCWTIIGGAAPYRTLNFPSIHCAFASGAAMATGVAYGLLARGDTDARVVTWAGDGGTFDIGLQALSGAIERNVPFTYVCYDNEAYMNTGIQRSSATPLFAETMTTPGHNFKNQPKKDFMEILIAHDIPYAATASIAFPEDLEAKVKKAMAVKGPSVLHIFSPCPTGQGFAEKYSIKIARLAVESGIFPLYEYESRRYRITHEPRFEGLAEYLRLQSRFKNLQNDEQVKINENIAYKWKILKRKEKVYNED